MVEPERPQKIWRMRVACWIGKDTRTQAHACAHAPTPTHMHALTRTHTRTHTEKCAILFAFPWQQWFRERASVLR